MSFFHQVNLAKVNMNSNCKPVVQHHTLGHAHMRPHQEGSKSILISQSMCHATPAFAGRVFGPKVTRQHLKERGPWPSNDIGVPTGSQLLFKSCVPLSLRCSTIQTDMQRRPRNVLNTNKQAGLLSWKHWATLPSKVGGEHTHWQAHIPDHADRNRNTAKRKGNVCLAPLVDTICACVRSFQCRPLQQCSLSSQFPYNSC